MVIDYDWLVQTNAVADKAEQDNKLLLGMTNEQLSYLAYWNWGYSGSQLVEVTKAAIAILDARGVDYITLGEQVEAVVCEYY